MDYISEPERKIKVIDNYDVIVCGGGIAGISAAVSAARQNKKVMLTEQNYLLGGLATAGLITIYLPLCDGKGKQVSYGIAEELLKLSIKNGIEGENPGSWLKGKPDKKHRYRVRYNANMFAILCEELLIKNNVHILYGTSVCNVSVENGFIKAVITENKSGRTAYGCKSVVDATGDADICALSGEKTENFKTGNILASWYYEVLNGKYELCCLGASDVYNKYMDVKLDDAELYSGLDGEERSRMTVNSHRNLINNFLKNGGINENHALANISVIPQLRMTRKIVGNYILDDTEVFKHFDTSIGMVSDWRKAGPVYEIPFECLYGKTVKNLICAGRNISVTDAMWDITRVIPDCAVTGQAAGTAAALSDDFAKLDIKILQDTLIKNGVKLHLKDIGL